eukprot:m.13659 g.13659  ORF g.13659 m.13659 type:complete len:103 (-) comp9801_c0_seq1:210-518(-)
MASRSIQSSGGNNDRGRHTSYTRGMTDGPKKTLFMSDGSDADTDDVAVRLDLGALEREIVADKFCSKDAEEAMVASVQSDLRKLLTEIKEDEWKYAKPGSGF